MAAILTDFFVDSEKPYRIVQAFIFLLELISHLIILNDRALLQILFRLPAMMNVCELAPMSLSSFPKITQGCTHSQHER